MVYVDMYVLALFDVVFAFGAAAIVGSGTITLNTCTYAQLHDQVK